MPLSLLASSPPVPVPLESAGGLELPRALARLLAPDFPLLAAPKENAGAVVWEETARHRRLPPN